MFLLVRILWTFLLIHCYPQYRGSVDAVKRKKDDQTSLGFIDALSSLMSTPQDIIGSALGSDKESDASSFTISDADKVTSDEGAEPTR